MSTDIEHRQHGGAIEQQAAKPDLVVKLEQAMPELARLGIDSNRFARIVLTECRENPQLLQCSPASFMGAAFASAQLQLEPGKLGQVWWVPRRNRRQGTTDVQFMIGYRGMVELARRAGVIVTVETVHAHDHFEVTAGTSPSIVHRPTLEDRGEAIAWYAVARFPDGRTVHRVLNRDDVDERRKQSASKDRGPWVTHFDAMARKSAIRALWSQLPMVPELQEAQRLDEQVLQAPADGGPVRPQLSAGDDAEDAEVVDEGDPLDTATISDLRQACGDAELSKAGSRDELVARLKAARAAAQTSAEEGTGAGPRDVPEPAAAGQGNSGEGRDASAVASAASPGPARDDLPPMPPPPGDQDEENFAALAAAHGLTPEEYLAKIEEAQRRGGGDTATDVQEDDVTDPQRRKLFALFHEHGITEAQRVALIRNGYGAESMNDLTVEQTVKLIDVLEQPDGPERFRAAADEWIAAAADHDDLPRPQGSPAGEGLVTSPAGDAVQPELAPEEEPAPEPEGPSLQERAHARAEATAEAKRLAPYIALRGRIEAAWRVLANADRPVYEESWRRVHELLGGPPPEAADWSGAGEVPLRREAERLERTVTQLEVDGKVR